MPAPGVEGRPHTLIFPLPRTNGRWPGLFQSNAPKPVTPARIPAKVKSKATGARTNIEGAAHMGRGFTSPLRSIPLLGRIIPNSWHVALAAGIAGMARLWGNDALRTEEANEKARANSMKQFLHHLDDTVQAHVAVTENLVQRAATHRKRLNEQESWIADLGNRADNLRADIGPFVAGAEPIKSRLTNLRNDLGFPSPGETNAHHRLDVMRQDVNTLNTIAREARTTADLAYGTAIDAGNQAEAATAIAVATRGRVETLEGHEHATDQYLSPLKQAVPDAALLAAAVATVAGNGNIDKLRLFCNFGVDDWADLLGALLLLPALALIVETVDGTSAVAGELADALASSLGT